MIKINEYSNVKTISRQPWSSLYTEPSCIREMLVLETHGSGLHGRPSCVQWNINGRWRPMFMKNVELKNLHVWRFWTWGTTSGFTVVIYRVSVYIGTEKAAEAIYPHSVLKQVQSHVSAMFYQNLDLEAVRRMVDHSDTKWFYSP